VVLRGAATLGVAGLSGFALPACGGADQLRTRPVYARGVLAKTTDIPAHGDRIFHRQQVVVTQPQPGEYRAFDAVCTHLGCLVTSVDGGTTGDCHGSRSSLADG